jgi:hypothetical protein
MGVWLGSNIRLGGDEAEGSHGGEKVVELRNRRCGVSGVCHGGLLDYGCRAKESEQRGRGAAEFNAAQGAASCVRVKYKLIARPPQSGIFGAAQLVVDSQRLCRCCICGMFGGWCQSVALTRLPCYHERVERRLLLPRKSVPYYFAYEDCYQKQHCQRLRAKTPSAW